MIYTFYSYKGGVGRSMALANVAELFYQAGLKVLMVDWDLEAPGLERFFPVDLNDVLDRPGVIDMLLGYKKQMAQEFPNLGSQGESLPFEKPDQFIVDIYPSIPSKGRLKLLSAGRRSKEYFADYAHAVRTFDWQDFYQNWEGELYFEWLHQQFRQMADVVLIDSRTGVTEMGGVCTYQMADTIVMFCTPNRQSIDGTYEMARNFKNPEVRNLRRGRPLDVLIIPARIERAESELLDRFHEEYLNVFADFVPQAEGIDISQLWQLGIPYVPKYAFTEEVAVRESNLASAGEMVTAFRRLEQVIWFLNTEAVYSDELILAGMPHFIAINYRRALDTQTARERVELILHTYDLVLRMLTICMVSQYLVRDRDRVRDPYLNDLLLQKFPHLTLDAWQQLFFASLKAYEGQRDLFFMSELYDFYWDTSTLPHQRRTDVEPAFDRLTQIATEVTTKQLLPQEVTGWEGLANETIDLLRQILHSLTFIGKYDLIRVLDYNEQFYDFELQKGIEVSTGHLLLPRHGEFSRGWLYLRKGTEDFLLLHPLLVFWEREPGGTELVLVDIGVYDRFVYDRLQYLLPTLRKTVTDDKSVKAFVSLLYETIEELKRKRQEAETLTWWQVRDICTDITRQRMATVRNKYRRELYLQRDAPRRAFEEFLQSDKRGFVLTGKSGVGKSNFLFALADELQSRSNVCMLMYDGAHLNVEQSLTEVIGRDFDSRVVLAGQQVQRVWYEIAKIEGIEERLVILCVDAVNENPHAKELLRQLDELVQEPWSWLKVVFTSRPETWLRIKRGVKLAEALYYWKEGAETLGVELEPFTSSEGLEPFSPHELPQVYARYQQAFRLQTPYETLPGELREVLGDPLNLWLVAGAYAGKMIPVTLKVDELVEEYINALLQSGRLQEEDLRFLEKQLVPLMMQEGHYRNVITIEDIDASGGGLYEAVYSEQVLSDGRRMNQSFTNLLDAEILMRFGEGREHKIAFKHEYIYDYFIGRQILELSGSQSDPSTFFNNLINRTVETAFLWKAVKHALIGDAKNRGADTALRLCFTEQQRVKQMMIEMLVDYGHDEPKWVEGVLNAVVTQTKKGGITQSVRRLFDRSATSANVRTQNAREIAVEVANQLSIPLVQIGITDRLSG